MCLLFREKQEEFECQIDGVNMTLPVHSERGDLQTKSAFYTEGYKLAADALVDKVLLNYQNDTPPREPDARVKERLIEPAIIFLYRQYIELQLKHIILFDSKKVDDTGNPLGSNTQKSIANSLNHDLVKQWATTRKILEDTIQNKGSKFFNYLSEVEKYITEFAGVDGDSYSFRYPYNKKIIPVPISEYVFDLKFLRDGMDKLHKALEMMSDAIQLELN